MNSSIWPIHRNLTGTTNPFRVYLRVMSMNIYSTLPKVPSLEPHYQMQFCVILMTLDVEVGFYLFTEVQSGVFYSPS